tara:strand:- start:617 stop:778 length:162 start_codon:yes stop_codon:yes gene_type:complete
MKLFLVSLIGLIGTIAFIELVHVTAHKAMEKDVHGHCMKNREGAKRILRKSGY